MRLVFASSSSCSMVLLATYSDGFRMICFRGLKPGIDVESRPHLMVGID